MQLMPLQNLDVVLLKIETSRKHAGDVAITGNIARAAEQFNHAAILVVLDRVFRLRDEVGVVFNAHGYRA
jgi:hypothetical protein